jgi:hypothetical protein
MRRLPHRSARLGTVVGAVLGVLCLTGTAFAAASWTVVTVPSSDPGDNAILEGTSVRTSTDAWAVGTQFGPAGAAPASPIAYRWNGVAWSRTATPPVPTGATGAGLLAVSASSGTDAWAVGFTLPQNGGYHGNNSLFEHWDGKTWSIVPGANSGRLVGVADLSPTNAWTASSTGLIEHWDGTSWTVAATPHPNPSDTVGDHFTSLTADGPDDVWAVGTFAAQSTDNSSIYALHYNGTSWSVASLPQPAAGGILLGVSAVSAVSPTSVWVAGSANGGAYVERFDGTTWREVTMPAGLFYPTLTAVSARSSTDVWAIGREFTSATGTTSVQLFLHWDGTVWSAAPSPAGSGYNQVYAAASGAGSPFWAVGVDSGNQPLVLTHS